VKRSLSVLAVLLALAAFLAAAPKTAKDAGTTVDSGTFEVLVNGQRVATENFKIQQTPAGSVTTTTIKVTAGGVKAEQSSVLEISPAGELLHYAWKELSPGKAQTTIEVSSGALLQRITMPDAKKPMDVPYLMPPTTFILDDNFFTHRQLLVWRYLGGCMKEGKLACAPGKLGIIVPAQHLQGMVSLEVVGLEKQSWKGAEHELLRVKLSSDDIVWDIWVDPGDSYKVLKISIPANKTEVLRT